MLRYVCGGRHLGKVANFRENNGFLSLPHSTIAAALAERPQPCEYRNRIDTSLCWNVHGV